MELNSKQENWLKALRSNDYQQGRGVLKQRLADGSLAYCCLGVACEILEMEWDDPISIINKPEVYPVVTYDAGFKNNSTGFFDQKYERLLGLTTGDSFQCVKMNDGGESFATIANWLTDRWNSNNE